jgi:hypothetical protein
MQNSNKPIKVNINGVFKRSCFGASIPLLVSIQHSIRSHNMSAISSNTNHLFVPKELWRLVDHLFRNAIDEPGIFIRNGMAKEIAEIRECLDCSLMFGKFKIHSFAEALVRFLEALAQPVFPKRLRESFQTYCPLPSSSTSNTHDDSNSVSTQNRKSSASPINSSNSSVAGATNHPSECKENSDSSNANSDHHADRMYAHKNEQYVAQFCKDSLRRMHPYYYNSFTLVVCFLRVVLQRSHSNLLTVDQCAIVFAMCLMHVSDNDMAALASEAFHSHHHSHHHTQQPPQQMDQLSQSRMTVPVTRNRGTSEHTFEDAETDDIASTLNSAASTTASILSSKTNTTMSASSLTAANSIAIMRYFLTCKDSDLSTVQS